LGGLTGGYARRMDALPRNYSSRVPSLYTLLAELPLEIDVYHTERKELEVSSGFLRSVW